LIPYGTRFLWLAIVTENRKFDHELVRRLSQPLTSLCSYLGVVDLIGTMYEDDVVATGFGNYVCLPLLRKAGTDLSKEEARKVLEDCMRVLFYRNCKSSTKVENPSSRFSFHCVHTSNLLACRFKLRRSPLREWKSESRLMYPRIGDMRASSTRSTTGSRSDG
jgi:hypothetical protein